MLHTRRFLLPVFVLCTLVFAGCGGGTKGPTIKGTVVLPSNVKLNKDDSATLVFLPDGEGGKEFAAPINASDLTFSAVGPLGKGVTPGNYKITVKLQPYAPGNSPERKAFDQLNTKYSSGSSKLTYKVTEESVQSIAVDLNAGTVTKK
ncbi:MAG TPA: hypothetical protein VMG10_23795 [Gemmataceae bacterium]|nr:hypothetical protein [Gemmataceae bacterium]